MTPTGRRSFLGLLASTPLWRGEAASASAETARSNLVRLSGDGLALSPAETVADLERILDERGIEADYYSLGGIVEELETKMAAALGKERAIFFPTGTLANHVAVRVLAGDRARVIVPHDSHLYNDSGDCAQQLSQLNLVPLASKSATFTRAQVAEVVERTRSGRVDTGVGAVVIESPVRRRLGELFDYEEMKRVCDYARDQGIKTHLDGARLYMASAFSGVTPKAYASLFDTVYVSLWKYFNAASGAILAGSNETIDALFHTRRMFGGGLPGAWPFAAVALHYFESFEVEYARAVETAKTFFTRLSAHDAFDVQEFPNGSNLFKLVVRHPDVDAFRGKLRDEGVILSAPRSSVGGFVVAVNQTLNRTTADDLVAAFVRAL